MVALAWLRISIPDRLVRRDDCYAQGTLNIVVVAGIDDEIADPAEAAEGVALQRDIAGGQRVGRD